MCRIQEERALQQDKKVMGVSRTSEERAMTRSRVEGDRITGVSRIEEEREMCLSRA